MRLFNNIREAKAFFFELKKKFPIRLDRCANGPVEALAFLISKDEKTLTNYHLARYIVLHAHFGCIYSILCNARDGVPVISRQYYRNKPVNTKRGRKSYGHKKGTYLSKKLIKSIRRVHNKTTKEK